MALIKWRNGDPFFGDLFDIQDEINRIFDLSVPKRSKEGKTFLERVWSPAVDVSEDKDNIYVKAELPGLKQEEINVSLEDDVLTIQGERTSEKEEKDKQYHRIERSYGAFQRAIHLPTVINEESIKATYKNGVLDITLAKKEEAKRKQIKVDVK